VEGQGFKLLGQGLINIGAKYGKTDVNKVLPHPSTVSKKVSDVAYRIRREFLPEVRKSLKEGTGLSETDLWID